MTGRILVVDDNDLVRESYCDLLRDRGYAVEDASDGEEALTRIREGGIDLAIIDVMMPSIGGLELRQTLETEHPNLFTILVTGQPEQVDGLVEDDPDFVYGRVTILNKPIHPVKLLAEVDKRLAT